MGARALGTVFESGTKIDRDAGIIKGVAVITEGVANGEIVDALTVRQIKACCETYANGLKVVDRHTTGTDSIFSTVGFLRNFRIEGKKLLADLHLLRAEANTAKLMEMAEMIPDTFGLSVAFSGPDETVDGRSFARCAEIYNAALVDVPAANPTGLFSDARADMATHFVDARTKIKTMGAENTNPQSGTEATTSPDNIAVRVKKLEDMLSGYEKKFAEFAAAKAGATDPDKDGDTAACMSKMQTQLKELSATLETKTKELASKIEDRSEMAKAIAKEFAANTGASPAVRANPTDTTTGGGAAEPEKGSVKSFIELAKKAYADTKSKVQAIRVASDKDPAGYAAFRNSGQQIKYT